ncbi:MAG TPA: Clp protease N-terminal domain-containing protein, partial [Actinomycetes bacterium]|nr:Clp protease N-terminal domain-containing protein [Actinomycetes bacterium]
MFERFTDRARRVVVLAQEEARHLNHNYIGTEHILLGLIHEREGIAARALTALDISLEAVRGEVTEIVGRGQSAPTGHIPFTPRAKKVLELSLREALQFGHNYIGTEHILLGLIREGEGVAAQVLVKLGASFDRVRQQVVQLLAGANALQAEQVAGMPSRLSQQQAMAMVAGGPGVYQEEPAELVRVVPVAREVHREAGMRVVLISLEIWSGWLDLRFAMLPGSSSGGRTQWLLDWRVEDDTGTAYEKAGMA